MANVLAFPDYRSFLRAELSERLSRNSGYSLRAFARDLDVAPSLLSAILGASRPLTSATAVQIGERLGMGGSEVEYFSTLAQFEREKSSAVKAGLQDRLRALSKQVDRDDMALDAFQAIAEWYHIPILVLMDLPGFRMVPASIAEKLGITPLQAEAACERLVRLGMMTRAVDGKFERKSDHMHFGSEVPHKALRQYQQRILEKGARALDEQIPEERFVGSSTVAFHKSRMPRAKACIEQFQREFMQVATRPVEGDTDANEVYQLGVVFFRTSRPAEKGNA